MQGCSLYRNVRQFNSCTSLPQHESSEAHVPSADEIRGNSKRSPKSLRSGAVYFALATLPSNT